MAAPSVGTRVVPTGKLLREGYKSLIALAGDTNIEFWEIGVSPPAMDNGDPIDNTTQHNVQYTTKAPRGNYEILPLIDYGIMTVTVAYDPICYTSVRDRLGKEDTITKQWGEGSKLAFYGYVKSFTPDEEVRGEMPTATVELVVTNWDPTNKVEAGPVYSGVSGT